jgi:hypothetical protein
MGARLPTGDNSVANQSALDTFNVPTGDQASIIQYVWDNAFGNSLMRLVRPLATTTAQSLVCGCEPLKPEQASCGAAQSPCMRALAGGDNEPVGPEHDILAIGVVQDRLRLEVTPELAPH